MPSSRPTSRVTADAASGVQQLAATLFARVAAIEGALMMNPEGGTWIELLCSREALTENEAKALRLGSRNIARRCWTAAVEAIAAFDDLRRQPAVDGQEVR